MRLYLSGQREYVTCTILRNFGVLIYKMPQFCFRAILFKVNMFVILVTPLHILFYLLYHHRNIYQYVHYACLGSLCLPCSLMLHTIKLDTINIVVYHLPKYQTCSTHHIYLTFQYNHQTGGIR